MSDSNLPAPAPILSSYPRRVAVLLLLIFNTVIAFHFLFDMRPDTHALVRHFLADMSIGLVAGFGTRILLRKHNRFVRVITATASLIIGLVVLGAFSDWRTGLGPLSFWRDTIDWAGLAQMLTGGTGIFLSMRAWSKPTSSGVSALVPAAQLPAAAVGTQPRQNENPNPSGQALAKPKRKRKKTASSNSAHPSAAAGSSTNTTTMRNNPARTETPAVSTQPVREQGRSNLPVKPVITRKQNKAAPKLALRKPKVRLSKVENHLCPYCLEPVLKNDPRGMVECEICHTQHHGDCWAIAGFCQVPHFTA